MYDTQHSSPTAIACEQAELFGATPGPDEPDNRDLWDQDDAMHAVDSAFHAKEWRSMPSRVVKCASRRCEAPRSRDTGGSGLGLAIVRSIVRGHGGDTVPANRAEGGLRTTLARPGAERA